MEKKQSEAKQMEVKEVLTPMRFMDYEQELKNSRLIELTLKHIDRHGMDVCDIAGASGVFLGELLKRSEYSFNPTLVEVVDDYRPYVVDEKINFRLASILENDIPDNSFDIITFRHMIHHLVADNISKTIENQQTAFEQVFRILRPGGHIIFQEQVHYVKMFSRIVYHMSLLANKVSLKSKFFDAGTVVVAFPTPNEIENFIDAATTGHTIDIKEYFNESRDMPLRWKLTMLMKNVGDVTYVIKVSDKN